MIPRIRNSDSEYKPLLAIDEVLTSKVWSQEGKDLDGLFSSCGSSQALIGCSIRVCLVICTVPGSFAICTVWHCFAFLSIMMGMWGFCRSSESDSEYEWLVLIQTPLSYKLNLASQDSLLKSCRTRVARLLGVKGTLSLQSLRSLHRRTWLMSLERRCKVKMWNCVGKHLRS